MNPVAVTAVQAFICLLPLKVVVAPQLLTTKTSGTTLNMGTGHTVNSVWYSIHQNLSFMIKQLTLYPNLTLQSSLAFFVVDYIAAISFSLSVVIKTSAANDKQMLSTLIFHKVFDSVPHSNLLSKLQSLGISEQLHAQFKAYLDARSQLVAINEHLFCQFPVTSGVPQGNILGLQIFLVYMNNVFFFS